MALLLERLVRGRVFRLSLGGDPLSPHVYALLLNAARLEFERGGVRSNTASLRDAVQVIHALLRERNQSALPSERAYVSVACAAPTAGGAYVALAGTASAYRVSPSELSLTPLRNERLSRQPQHAQVGAQATPSITLGHTRLEAQDRLVLVAGESDWPAELIEPWRHEPHELVEAIRAAGATGVCVLDADCGVLAELAPSLQTEPLRDSTVTPADREEMSSDSTEDSAAEAESDSMTHWRPGPLTATTAMLIVFLLGLGYWLGRPGLPSPEEHALREAAQQVAIAERSPHSAEAAEALKRATQALTGIEAASVPPKLASRFRSASDQTFVVQRLGPGRLIMKLDPAQNNATQMALSPDGLFVLDAGNSALHRISLASETEPSVPAGAETMLAKGGLLAGRTVGDLVGLASLPGTNSLRPPRIVAVDTERTLIVLEPGQPPSRVAPPGNAEWQQVGPMAGSGGKLYLVDSGRGWLLEYDMTGASVGPPRAVVQQTNTLELGESVGLAAGGEHLYLLQASGRLRRYSVQAGELAFEGRLPDRALNAPTGLALGQRRGDVYVADGGNGRVVQFDPDGRYVRQLQVAEGEPLSLEGLRAVAVDESAHRIFCLTPHGVVEFSLPAAGGA